MSLHNSHIVPGDSFSKVTTRRKWYLIYISGQVRGQLSRNGKRYMVNRLIADYDSGENKSDKEGEKLIGFSLDNAIVGLCGLNVEPTNGKYGRIRRLYILPEYRNRGIGTRLVKHLIRYAGRNFEGIVVNIGELPVDNFYRSLGFRSVSNSSFTHFLALSVR